jgi:AcrR family transcriptional regulator
VTPRGRGRPSIEERVSPTKILSEAVDILDDEGFDRLTMRALAARVGINPMTIYHHFKDRDGLIKALADTVYSDVSTPANGDARTRVAGLLAAYRAKVVQHPALSLAIFSRPTVFPDHAKRITVDLTNLLRDLGASPKRSLLWAHILVDYTQGAALAVAVRGEAKRLQASIEHVDDNYETGIAELLDALDQVLLPSR